ncbi:fumarylacetoacetate hydrolase family protein [Candidatus Poribacteria bacterium]|nr:fumarylacetoacetate hydrolase family protein [Candidatus Poribacteria bacterium]
MKLVSFEESGVSKLGALINAKILDLKPTYEVAFPDCAKKRSLGNMMTYLNQGEAAKEAAQKAIDYAVSNPAKAVWGKGVLQAPVPCPPKLLLLAGNYAAHIREGGGEAPEKKTTTPRFFMKPPSITVIAHEQPIIIPPNAVWVDWEAEFGVVIGKRGKFISAGEAYNYVAGYTIVNDVSERELRIETKRVAREMDDFFDWLNGKWIDTFAPMGPCMVTKDEIPNPDNLQITLKVNGITKQDSNTGNMIFNAAELIEFISRYITLEPGDVISTGTPEGTGHALGERLKDGDIVEIEIEKIGVLRNPVRNAQ